MKHLALAFLSFLVFTSFSHAGGQYKLSHNYKCIAVSDGYKILLTVNVNNMDDKIRLQKDLADIDRNYIGRSHIERRFVYEESDEGLREAFLQADLLNGALQGLMAIRTHGDDSTNSRYVCYLIK